jgi:hypothetical protein
MQLQAVRANNIYIHLSGLTMQIHTGGVPWSVDERVPGSLQQSSFLVHHYPRSQQRVPLFMKLFWPPINVSFAKAAGIHTVCMPGPLPIAQTLWWSCRWMQMPLEAFRSNTQHLYKPLAHADAPLTTLVRAKPLTLCCK